MNSSPCLYKYLSMEAALAVLRTGTLRWTVPRLLNDPYDVQFDLYLDMVRGEVKNTVISQLRRGLKGKDPIVNGNKLGDLINQVRSFYPASIKKKFDREWSPVVDEMLDVLVKEVVPELQAIIRYVTSHVRVLCFSMEPTILLMWAHYAQSHQGLVLCFQAADEHSSLRRPTRMKYVKNMPVLSSAFISDLLSGRADLDAEKILDDLFYSKSDHWGYERELRFDGRNSQADADEIKYVPFDPADLVGVTLGCRSPSAFRTEVLGIVAERYPHAEICLAKMNARQFEIGLVPARHKAKAQS